LSTIYTITTCFTMSMTFALWGVTLPSAAPSLSIDFWCWFFVDARKAPSEWPRSIGTGAGIRRSLQNFKAWPSPDRERVARQRRERDPDARRHLFGVAP